jgi:hypothetical protein
MITLRTLACTLALAPLPLSTVGCASHAAAGPHAATPSPAPARPAQPTADEPAQVRADPAFDRRVEEIVAIMNGGGDPAQTFSPGFLAQAPAERLVRMTRTMRETYGTVVAVSRVRMETPHSGAVVVDLERSQMELQVGVQPAAPHQVRTLLIRPPAG